jgi:hypothetical protein
LNNLRHIFSVLFLIVSFGNISLGQTYLKIDTIKVYDFVGLLKYQIQGGDTTCSLNEKPFPVKEYQRIEKYNCKLWGDCRDTSQHIFYVNTYDLNERPLFSTYQIDPENIFFGSYKEYYSNGIIKIEGQYLFFGNDWKQYENEKNWNKKDGVWKYYNENGKLKRTKTFKHGRRKWI